MKNLSYANSNNGILSQKLKWEDFFIDTKIIDNVVLKSITMARLND